MIQPGITTLLVFIFNTMAHAIQFDRNDSFIRRWINKLALLDDQAAAMDDLREENKEEEAKLAEEQAEERKIAEAAQLEDERKRREALESTQEDERRRLEQQLADEAL